MMNKIIKLPKEVDIIFPKSGMGILVDTGSVFDGEVVEGDGEVVEGVEGDADLDGDGEGVEVVEGDVDLDGDEEVVVDGIVVCEVVVAGEADCDGDGNEFELIQ